MQNTVFMCLNGHCLAVLTSYSDFTVKVSDQRPQGACKLGNVVLGAGMQATTDTARNSTGAFYDLSIYYDLYYKLLINILVQIKDTR